MLDHRGKKKVSGTIASFVPHTLSFFFFLTDISS